MANACKVYLNESDVRKELSQMGLSVQILQDVLRHIALTINSHTEDHPSWGPGITTASEAVFALRSILRPYGWSREEDKGFALTIHPENQIAINIAKGDEGTGDPTTDVLTVSDKGICTENAILKNQLSFDFPEVPETPELIKPSRQTWYLLYAKKQDGIHAEFSLPVGLAESRQISAWRKRIMLPITREDGDANLTAGYEDNGFEINISRKGG